MVRAPRGKFALLVLAAMLATPGALGGEPAVLGAVAGLGFDAETGEESPVRAMAGLDVDGGRLRCALIADCGIPWEPSAALSLDVLLLDLDALRAAIEARFWLRAWADAAVEGGASTGVAVEVGPRAVALGLAGGLGMRGTRFAEIDVLLEDAVPWARLGVVARPMEEARLELSLGSDSPLALWLRTSFELAGSWRFASGVRLEGLLAARYSDFFTLTAHLDGFDARVLVAVPIAGGAP